jgi:hypothetical protein
LQIPPNTQRSCSQHKILTRNLKPTRSYRKQTNTHTHTSKEREKNNNNNEILTRNLKPTRTYRNKQTHTKREKQQQKSFLCSHKTKSTKFLAPNLEPTRSYKERNTHTHTHTQKRQIHTIQREKQKQNSHTTKPNQTQNKIFTHRREDRFKAITLQTRLLVLQKLPLFPKGKLKQQQQKNKLLLERIYSQDRMGKGKGVIERERRKKKGKKNKHTHTHTHTNRQECREMMNFENERCTSK